MKTRITHNGAGIVMTEYEIRDLDKYGDVINVDHAPDKRTALQRAEALLSGGALAVVIERHISKHPAFLFDEPNRYEWVAEFGAVDVIQRWKGYVPATPQSPSEAPK